MKEKLTIIKVGGKIVEEESTLNQLLADFSAIEGYKLLVHGGGRSATRLAAQLGIESKMVNGRRIRNAESGNHGIWRTGEQEYCSRPSGKRCECHWTDRSRYECDPFGKASGKRRGLWLCW